MISNPIGMLSFIHNGLKFSFNASRMSIAANKKLTCFDLCDHQRHIPACTSVQSKQRTYFLLH